jgi:mono/diheme cytochrome c family protein
MGRFLLGCLVALVAIAVAGAAVVLGGLYDIAARTPHTAPVAWVLTTARTKAIEHAAAGLAAPASFTDAQVRQGRAIYGETCVYCHGAPGEDPTDWSAGMNPEPPYMPDIAGGLTPAQLFWVVRNGIRMTGMPSFDKALDEAKIWGVVAFVKRLPGMTEEQYGALGEAAAPAH